MRHFYRLPLDTLSKHLAARYRDELIGFNFKVFHRKHGQHQFRYFSKRSLKFKTIDLYLYEEDGIAYEFFSGYKIGKIVDKSDNFHTRIDLESNVLGNFVLYSTDSDIYDNASKLSAAQFSAQVEPHMREKKQIAKILSEYCELCSRANQVEEEKAIMEKKRLLAEEARDISWIDSFLSERQK